MKFLRGGEKSENEAKVLKHFKKNADKFGGLFFKISDRYMTGFPDLIYIKNGRVFFVELKANGKLPRPAQASLGLRIKSENGNWICLDSTASVDSFFDNILEVNV